MGIFKDTLYPFVHDQLYIRQSIAAHGLSMYGKNNFNGNNIIGDSPGYRGGDDSSDINLGTNMEGVGSYAHFSSDYHSTSFGVYDMTDDERELRNKLRGKTIPHEYWHSWMTQKYCGIRMASMVDLVSEDILDLDYEFNGVILEEELLGFGLARNYMLEGGTLLTPEGFNNPQMRAGFPSQGKLLGTAYGDPLSRSDSRRDDYGEHHGIVPMAGITNVNIRTKSAYGSLREAKVEFVCHNLRQLSVMELLYMRPGYPILLEWGWSPYINNSAELVTDFEYISNDNRFWGRKGTGASTMEQQEITDIIGNRKRESSGNYDGLLGLCKNFSYTARDDGGFNCTTELMGVGEVISSLKSKSNPLATTSVTKKGKNVSSLPITKVTQIPALADFITQTYDYVLGGQKDSNRTDDNYITKQRPGDDGKYGTDDDPGEERGDQAHYSERYLKQPVVWDPWIGGSYKWRKNRKRAKVEIGYDNFYFKPSLFEGENIFSDTYMTTFKENMWNGWNESLGIMLAVANPLLYGIAAAGIYFWDLFKDKDQCITEGYIRLDALLYNINATMIPSVPKGKDKKNGSKITSYQTLHYNPHTSDSNKYRMHTFNSYVPKLKEQWTSLWMDEDPENPTGEQGEYIDRSNAVDLMDISINPYVCLTPNMSPKLFSEETGGNITYKKDYIAPIRNYIGYNSADFAKGGAFDASFDISTSKKKKARLEEAKSSIGHLMLNVEHLIEIHTKLYKENKDYGIGEFLNILLADINKSMGSTNLSIVTDNEYSHIANIIDLNKAEKSPFSSIFKFNVLSNDSCVKNFSFNTAIPTAMSSTIAIASMNPDSANDLDNVTFASMNRGISNRLYRNTPPDIKKQTKEQKKKKIYAYRKQQAELNLLINNLGSYMATVSSGKMFAKNNEFMNKVSEMSTCLERAYSLSEILSTKDNKGDIKQNPMSPTPIPINIDLELEGLSGMVIGQMFRINESRLPKQYRHKKICFIIIKEDQSITTDGVWTTKLTGQMQLFPDDANKLNDALFTPKPKVVKKPPIILGVTGPDARKGQMWCTGCNGEKYICQKNGATNQFDPVDQKGRDIVAACLGNKIKDMENYVRLYSTDWNNDNKINAEDTRLGQEYIDKLEEERIKKALEEPTYDWNNDDVFDAEDKKLEDLYNADPDPFAKNYMIQRGGKNGGPLKKNPNK